MQIYPHFQKFTEMYLTLYRGFVRRRQIKLPFFFFASFVLLSLDLHDEIVQNIHSKFTVSALSSDFLPKGRRGSLFQYLEGHVRPCSDAELFMSRT